MLIICQLTTLYRVSLNLPLPMPHIQSPAQQPAQPNPATESERMLVDFGQRDNAANWLNVDDPVMGGVSRSRMIQVGNVARFSGMVSLENNGGFASVRSANLRQLEDLRGFTSVRVKVKGDGKTYIFSLQTATAPRLNYWQRFRTVKDTWTEATLPFSQFVPILRGFTPFGSPRLDVKSIASYAIFIADKQVGPFVLDVAWVKAVKVEG